MFEEYSFLYIIFVEYALTELLNQFSIWNNLNFQFVVNPGNFSFFVLFRSTTFIDFLFFYSSFKLMIPTFRQYLYKRFSILFTLKLKSL